MLGLSLIEVLVSLVLLSLLFLGGEAIQYVALRDTKTAYYVSVANTQLNNMAERIKVGFQQDIDNEVIKWNAQNDSLLPHGIGKIRREGSLYVLSLFWGKNHENDECYQNNIGPTGCLRLVINSTVNAA